MIRFNKEDSDDDIRIKQWLQTFEGLTVSDIQDLLTGYVESGTTTEVHLEPLYGMFNTKDVKELSQNLFGYVN